MSTMDDKIILSVLIPTMNRAKYLKDLLFSFESLDKVNYNWEVIVIDNCSTDNTGKVVEEFIKRKVINIKYYYEQKIGLHEGRHRGAKEASGTYVAYLDDDMILCPGWLTGLKLLEEGIADAVVGKITPHWESEPPGWLLCMYKRNGNNLPHLSLLDQGNETKIIKPGMMYGGNVFIKKNLIFELGGFNPDGFPNDKIIFRGDGESGFFKVFGLKGYKSYYDPAASVKHFIPLNRLTKEYLYTRYYNQGISDSYSRIRQDKIIKNNLENPGIMSVKFNYKTKIKALLKFIFFNKKYKLDKELEEINTQSKIAKRKGYLFHYEQVSKNEDLYNWVVKENYMQ